MPLKRGKLPARANAVSLLMTDFLRPEALPTVPPTWGHVRSERFLATPIKKDTCLGNDRAGNCVIAGGERATQVWSLAAGRLAPSFTAETGLADYRRAQVAQGLPMWNPRDPDSDTGLDMQKAASWWRKVGLTDAAGNTHKIRGYGRIESLEDANLSGYMFGVAGVGARLPNDAEDRFIAGEIWDESGPPGEGHFVPLVGRNSAGLNFVVTWGRNQAFTKAWWDRYVDEALCFFSLEYLLATGISPEAFDQQRLDDALRALNRRAGS